MEENTPPPVKKKPKKKSNVAHADIPKIATDVRAEIDQAIGESRFSQRKKNPARELLIASEADCRRFLSSGGTYLELSKLFRKAGVTISVKQIGSVFGKKRKSKNILEKAQQKVAKETAVTKQTQLLNQTLADIYTPLPASPEEQIVELERREKLLKDAYATAEKMANLAEPSTLPPRRSAFRRDFS
jgi:hypothetical protein